MEVAVVGTESSKLVAFYRGIVINPKPPLDETASIAALERLQKDGPVLDIKIWNHSECSTEQIAEWTRSGYLAINLGEENYRKMKVGSATESVFEKLGYSAENRTSGENKLIHILDKHNNDKKHGGFLKSFYMSLARLIRELYEFPEYDQLDLINRLKDVTHAYLEVKDGEAYGSPANRLDSDLDSEFPDLVEATTRCQLDPFTVGRYLLDMWRLGRPIDEIREKVAFWLNAWNRFEEEMARARTEWQKIERVDFMADGFRGTAIETVNRFVPKIGAKEVDIFVTRRPDTGNTVFMTRRLDLSNLSQGLERLEKGKWYYHRSAGQLINGGPRQPDIQPTSLSLDQLVELVKRFPPR